MLSDKNLLSKGADFFYSFYLDFFKMKSIIPHAEKVTYPYLLFNLSKTVYFKIS